MQYLLVHFRAWTENRPDTARLQHQPVNAEVRQVMPDWAAVPTGTQDPRPGANLVELPCLATSSIGEYENWDWR